MRHASWLVEWFALTKPRISGMAALVAALGYAIGAPGPLDLLHLAATLLGTALVGGGANALNMWWEADRDRRMVRTAQRPIPTGRIRPAAAFGLGISLVAGGTGLLFQVAGALPAGLALLSAFAYILVYTPLKTRTTLNTIVGAVPGALPPVIGWSAARGTIDAGAQVLFVILFLWQLPHFLAIGWLFREDYARGGYRMLSVADPEGGSTARQAAVQGTGLLVASLLPPLFGVGGWIYLTGALVLGCLFLAATLDFARRLTYETARRVLLASIVYLPFLFGLLLLDRGP